MARKLAGGITGEGPATEGRSNSLSVSRRTYVRMGAIAAATLAGVSSVTGSTAAASTPYRTVTLDRNEQRSYSISDGETFENVLIDQTAHNSMFVLVVEEGANDWTIRNVGWKGVAPSGGAREYTFLINVRGDGEIENVFIDQRSRTGGEGSDVGAIWTFSDSHHGHIDCRHNFIAGCGNNASYPSSNGFAHRESTGTVSHYRSYHRDNTVSNFRPGIADSEIVECVSVINDPYGTRGSYPSTDSQLSRAIWAWHNPDIIAQNCAFWHDPNDVQPTSPFWATWRSGSLSSGGDRAKITIRDCDINGSWEAAGNGLAKPSKPHASEQIVFENLGTDPSVEILGEGVPTTPEMAAAGERELPPELGTSPSGGTGYDRDDVDPYSYDRAVGVHTNLPNELVLNHVAPGERVEYEVTFDGRAVAGEWASPPTVVDGVARGGMGPSRGLDNVYFDGEITRFEVDHADHARFYLADAQTREIIEEIDPADFGGDNGHPDYPYIHERARTRR